MIRVPEAVMGTVVSLGIDADADASTDALWLAVAEARAGLHRADAVFSTWKRDSPLSRLRRGEVRLGDCPPEVAEVLLLCALVRDQSDGWFDPWAMPGGVDPTGLVKGWAAGRAVEVVGAASGGGVIVSAGGDVAVHGRGPVDGAWQVGVAHPWRRGALAGVVAVAGGTAVCTSGTYERGAHLIDPRTGAPASRTVSATVVGPDVAVGDALATGLAVGGDEALAVLEGIAGYEGWIIRPDGSEATTAEWRFASLALAA